MKKEALLRWYDRLMNLPVYNEIFDHSNFFNFGYWDAGAQTQRQACEHLIERLLSFLPDRKGLLVDMACGSGATTAFVLQRYPEMRVYGTNLSANQLQTTHMMAPGGRFAIMDAARPALADKSVDCVMCVEAAFHFQTRRHFLAEAFRILRPGGRLVLTDILFSRLPDYGRPYVPLENFVTDENEYQQQVLEAGFAKVETEDATQACWDGYWRYTIRWVSTKMGAKQFSRADLLRVLSLPLTGRFLVQRYLLVAATKA